MSSYRNSLEDYLCNLEITGGSVLDIGGGANPVWKRCKSWHVDKYAILDNSAENMIETPLYEFDINYEIPLEEKRKIGHYDHVFCLEVFEYVFDPIIALSNIAYFMKDNGRLYITFPTLYPLHNPEGIDYLRYTRDSLDRLFEEVNLTIETITPRMPTEQGLEFLKMFYQAEGFHCRKYTNDIYSLGYIVRARK